MPLSEVGGLPTGLGRESVLGTYCLRIAGKRMGAVSRRRQLEQADSMSRADKAGERQWLLDPRYLLLSTYHPTLDLRQVERQ